MAPVTLMRCVDVTVWLCPPEQDVRVFRCGQDLDGGRTGGHNDGSRTSVWQLPPPIAVSTDHAHRTTHSGSS